MMAEKARLFGDQMIRESILNARTPRKAKSLGRKVSGFDENVWSQHRFDIVVAGNRGKFSQNEQLGEFLRCTGSKVLVEASARDRIWGIGMDENNVNVENPRERKGLNLLGFAVMEVRERVFG